MTTIELRAVGLHRPRRGPVLVDVDLTVRTGDLLTVCGPPGAGKTALLRVVVGLDQPTQGQVLLDGIAVDGSDPGGRNLAMVFADHAVHDHLDVWGNLALGARLGGAADSPELRDRVVRVAELLDLQPVLEQRARRLDAAQRQRVALGRALVREARGYLLDEVFSAQDSRSRSHLRSAVTRWQQEAGLTTVLTTSDPAEALTVPGWLAVLHRGSVRQVGRAVELYARPADLFVAAYLGSPQINVLPGTPSEFGVMTPLGELVLPAPELASIGERELVLVGLRPEHLHAGTSGRIADGVALAAVVDDVEWRGGSQLAYFGYDLDPAVESRLEAIEQDLAVEVFSNFLVAELPGDLAVRPGTPVALEIAASSVLLFDPETGHRITSA